MAVRAELLDAAPHTSVTKEVLLGETRRLLEHRVDELRDDLRCSTRVLHHKHLAAALERLLDRHERTVAALYNQLHRGNTVLLADSILEQRARLNLTIPCALSLFAIVHEEEVSVAWLKQGCIISIAVG